MIIARVCHTADDGDGHSLDTVSSVEAVNRTDQACCVAGCELEVILADTLLIVCIAVEEHVRDGVLLAALEDGLHAILVIIVFLILCAYAARCGVEHDIHLLAQICESTGDRDILGRESCLVSAVNKIEIVLDSVGADHVALTKSLQ